MKLPAKTETAQTDTEKPGVYIKTFGCQMNEYDSEKMLTMLAPSYQVVPSAEQAQVVIVNTCSVREKGEHKLYSLLGSLREIKQTRPEMVIGVAGCVAQQDGEGILKRAGTVDFIVGTHNLSLVPSLVERARNGDGPVVAVDYREEWEELPDEFNALPQAERESKDAQKMLQSAFFSPVRALIAIQRGCDKMCSFCVVPTTRGPQVSRSVAEILKEIRLKVRLGAAEVMLLGQTVNSFGLDLKPRCRFEDLVRSIAEIDGVKRIRFTSPHPAEVRKGFIELYKEIPQLCPHIHLPLQSGSDRILKLMNRNYRVQRYLEIVDELVQARPDIALTGDIIVGFPTESEEDFQQTLDVMRRVRYHSTFAFKYSPRPNTAALDAFAATEEISPALQQARLQELFKLQDELSLEANLKRVGEKVEVLVERIDHQTEHRPASLRGRIPHNTPIEVHPGTAETRVGQLVEAVVERASPYGLRANLINFN